MNDEIRKRYVTDHTADISTPPARLLPGDLDPSFGLNGRVTVPSRGIALPTGDGKYWIVTRWPGANAQVEIQRFLDNGTQDPAFMPKIVDLHPDATRFFVETVLLQSSGNIIVGGLLFFGDDLSVGLARFDHRSGELDPSFGDDGVKVIDFNDGNNWHLFYDMAIRPDDGIVVSAQFEVDSKTYPRVVKLLADGALDTAFGDNGVVYDLPETVYVAIAAPSNDKILLAGSSLTDGTAVLTRLRATGEIDTTFGDAGTVKLTSHDGSRMQALAIALPRDGDYAIVGGRILTGDGWLVRVLPDGTLDEQFNQGAPFYLLPSVDKMAVQEDGMVVFHGMDLRPPYAMAVGRVNAQGSLDSGFGTGGLVRLAPPVEFPHTSGESLAVIQGDKLFTSNILQYNTAFDVQLLRFLLT